MQPIAEKLVARMKRGMRRKVVNLKDVIAGRTAAEEPQRTVVSKEGLAGFHLAHAAYERHMNFGPTRAYWNGFVFESYVTHRTEAIYLAGLPDIPGRRPHSEVNSRRFRR